MKFMFRMLIPFLVKTECTVFGALRQERIRPKTSRHRTQSLTALGIFRDSLVFQIWFIVDLRTLSLEVFVSPLS